MGKLLKEFIAAVEAEAPDAFIDLVQTHVSGYCSARQVHRRPPAQTP